MRVFVRIAVLALGLGALGACASNNVLLLEPGTCFDDDDTLLSSASAVANVTTVDCTEEHDNEVYAVYALPEGDYPGAVATRDLADRGCVERFDDYVGLGYAGSSFAVGHLVPSEQSWAEGDREVVCFLYDMELAKLSTSAKHAGH